MSGPPVEEAARRVAEGGLVAFPTETVWGLAADARSEAAVASLRAWKGRDAGQPLSILVDDPSALGALGFDPSPAARRLMERLWPGPVTLVLPCKGRFATGVARRPDGAVGVRCSSHAVAGALAGRLRALGAGPATATSLNRSGEPPVESVAAARALCGDDPHVLDVPGAGAGSGGASAVLDCAATPPAIIRHGDVSDAERAELEACLQQLAEESSQR